MQNAHLRGADLDATARAVIAALAREGFALVVGDETGPSTRTIVLYAADGWVGIADDPFASTEWGAVLSRALRVPVITQAGECDHAFYSRVSVHEGGDLFHLSAVPADTTHGSDGRHRIKPRFLAKYVPAAAAAIELGIVVNKLGGEANMQAVGEALGIPRPLFSVHDALGDDRKLMFLFEGRPAAAGEPPIGGFFDTLLGDLAARLVPGAAAGGEPTLRESPTTSNEEAFCGEEHTMHCTFGLVGGESERGIVVRVTGSGLALFDLPTMTAETRDGSTFTATAVQGADGRTRLFHFPDVVLRHAPSPGLAGLPLAERVRQGMQRLRLPGMLDNPAEVTVRMTGRTTREGKGTFFVRGALTNGATATTEITVLVKPAVRLPTLPGGRSARSHEVETYAARDVAVGWVGFDAPWPELRDLVLGIAEPAMRALLEASGKRSFCAHVTRRGGEQLEHPDAKAAWSKLTAELERGADVVLRDVRDPFDGPSLAIAHQPQGANLFAGTLPSRERRPPLVELSWSCPRPRGQDDRDLIADLADFVFTSAGASAAHVGGVATAQRYASFGPFETSYEGLAGTRLETYDVRWLREHVRAPGFRVLVPAAAAERLATVEGVVARPVAHGVLLASSATDPFAYSELDAAAMERAVLEAVGVVVETD